MPNQANQGRKRSTQDSTSSNQANRANQGLKRSTQDSKIHYVHKVILTLNGSPAPDELRNDILEVTVEQGLYMQSTFVLKIHNVAVGASENTELWKNEKYFNIGTPISIGFVAGTTEDEEYAETNMNPRVIDGEITGIQVVFTNESKAHIVVRGEEISHRLYRGRYTEPFTHQTDKDIVERIAGKAGIKIGQLDPTGVVHKYVCQENQTNMEFLRERAARIGFELFVQNKKIYFRKPTSDGSIELKWPQDVTSFDVRVDSAEQVSSVQVNSWDYSQKKLISETVSKEKLVTETGNSNGSNIARKLKPKQPPKMIVVDRPANTAKEARQMAQALCDELGGQFVNADAKGIGNTKIRPGTVAELTNLGARYSGKYYITKTRHHYIKGKYTTSFSSRGLREGSLLSTIRLRPKKTHSIGIVTKNKDPEGWGRVKVEYTDTGLESDWARVLGSGAGNERGCYWLPEIFDEVLVGFEHGDIHRPIILGGLWNGKDKPVETVADTIKNGKVRVRTIKTRTGHEIQFVEENDKKSKAGIYVTSGDGQCVHLNDSEKCVNIKTSGKINLNASKIGGGININSTGGPINISSLGKGGINLVSNSHITMAATVINMQAITSINMATPMFTSPIPPLPSPPNLTAVLAAATAARAAVAATAITAAATTAITAAATAAITAGAGAANAPAAGAATKPVK